MALTARVGRSWSLNRDNEGYRTYNLVSLVVDNQAGSLPGPKTILDTSGLPLIGATWNYGTDSDPWAFCLPDARVTVHEQGEDGRPTAYRVEQKFSTRPHNRCQDTKVENPLLEPPEVSGSFVKYVQEVTEDKDGERILTSGHELIKGPQIEFDFNRPTVRISQNVANLELDKFSEMVDTVNDATLWGLGARKIKLSNAPWERNYYGRCFIYYTRTFEFDIDFNTFDRTVLDEGTKCIDGQWKNFGTDANPSWRYEAAKNTDPTNPGDFVQFIDKTGNPARVILDGGGFPLDGTIQGADTGTGTPATAGSIDVKYYSESNFLSLGIPTVL